MSIKLTHPAGGKVTASEDTVSMYESQGWVRTTTAATPAADTTKKK